VGTPDANGAPANMVGSLRLDTIAGNPATPANEADVNVSFSVTDVRCRTGVTTGPCTQSNAQGGSDYSGRLDIRVPLRVTDRYNLPAPAGNKPGSGDTTVDFYAYCSVTPDAGTGSTCPLATSIGAWYPGGVQEGRRAIAEVGQIQVLDGGADGYGRDAAPFLKAGIFIP